MMESPESPAMTRARQLFFETAGKDLPAEARRYAKVLGSKVGGCGETYITAFAHYAQDIEGLVCTEDLYMREGFSKDYYQEKA